MATCRSCYAEIEWTVTSAGKNMPMNVVETPCPKCGGQGTVDSLEEEPCSNCGGKGALCVSHFATCPNARKHRRK